MLRSCYVILCNYVIKDHVTLWMGPLKLIQHRLSFDPHKFYGSGDIISLICHGTSQDQRYVSLGKLEPLNLNHHCAKFNVYRSCGSGNIMLVFCNAVSRDLMIKEKCDLVNRIHLTSISHDLVKFDAYMSGGSRDITFRTCYITQQRNIV